MRLSFCKGMNPQRYMQQTHNAGLGVMQKSQMSSGASPHHPSHPEAAAPALLMPTMASPRALAQAGGDVPGCERGAAGVPVPAARARGLSKLSCCCLPLRGAARLNISR